MMIVGKILQLSTRPKLEGLVVMPFRFLDLPAGEAYCCQVYSVKLG
jgi:hypothetical protein